MLGKRISTLFPHKPDRLWMGIMKCFGPETEGELEKPKNKSIKDWGPPVETVVSNPLREDPAGAPAFRQRGISGFLFIRRKVLTPSLRFPFFSSSTSTSTNFIDQSKRIFLPQFSRGDAFPLSHRRGNVNFDSVGGGERVNREKITRSRFPNHDGEYRPPSPPICHRTRKVSVFLRRRFFSTPFLKHMLAARPTQDFAIQSKIK